MRRRWRNKVGITLMATFAAACGDATGPESPDYLDLALDFCSAAGQFPVFFAYLNEGEGWTRVDGGASQTFTFRASDRVGIAMVFQQGSEYATEVVYAKNEELEPLSGGECPEAVGTKFVDGSVSNVAVGDFSYVSMGVTTELVEPPPSTFRLVDLANEPLDLVAHSGSDQIDGEVPDAVIIRRGQNPSNGAVMPTLDFNSTEAALPTANTLTISGLSSAEDNLIDLFFSTATTFDHPFFLSSFFTAGTQTIYHVPSTLTLAGDLHMLDVYGRTANGLGVRGETQWYRSAGNRSVALGSALANPTVTTLESSPVVRLRTQLAVQPEYNSFATALFQQSGTTITRTVSVLGTAAYFGSPSSWQLDIPELDGVSGFPIASGLETGFQTPYEVVAYGGSLTTYFGAPEEGSTTKYAARFSNTNTMLAMREGTGKSRRIGPRLAKRKVGIR